MASQPGGTRRALDEARSDAVSDRPAGLGGRTGPGDRGDRHRRPGAAVLVTVVFGLVAGWGHPVAVAQPGAGPSVAADTPTAPAPLGAGGGCGQRSSTIAHPTTATESVTVFEPTGPAAATVGGACDGSGRPVILISHGYGGRTPLAYSALITHLVSRGFVVVYPTYPNAGSQTAWIPMQDAAFAAGLDASPRADRSRVGIVSHSMGGGMAPALAQLAGHHGWGSAGRFVVQLAPYYPATVGTGAIAVPAGTRWLTVSFESDAVLDHGLAIDTFEALDLPDDRKTHLTVLDDPASGLVAGHNVPTGTATDDMDVYGVWRPIDAVAGCALHGVDCAAALADAQVDDRPHPDNLVDDDPVDANLPLVNGIPQTECDRPINPRDCPLRPWVTVPRPRQAAVGGATPAQVVTFGDKQTATGTLVVTTSSGDPELLPPADVTATPTGAPTDAAAQLSVVARGAPGRSGRTTASVTVTDPEGHTSTRTFVVTFGDGAPAAGGTHPLPPLRLLDTRTEGGRVGAGSSVELAVAGRGGVPATGATGVVLNVTAEGPTHPGFVTASPTGDRRPLTSNLNTTAGRTRPNLVLARLGPDGAVRLFNSAGSTHLIVDVAGWVDDGRAGTSAGRSRYAATVPLRVLDTRDPPGTPLGAGAPRTLPVAAACAPAAAGGTVTAVAVNVTAVGPTTASHLTVWPSGGVAPEVSNLNYTAGEAVPNLVVVAVGAGGAVDLANHAGTVHVAADLAGCFVADAGADPTARGAPGVIGSATSSPGPAGVHEDRAEAGPTPTGAPAGDGSTGAAGLLVAATPRRLADTRFGTGTTAGPLAAGQVRTVAVAGHAGVPASGVAAVVVNVTGTEPTTATHLTAWPAGTTVPLASNVNLAAGQTAPNLAIVRLGADGALSFTTNSGTTHLVVDVQGWILA